MFGLFCQSCPCSARLVYVSPASMMFLSCAQENQNAATRSDAASSSTKVFMRMDEPKEKALSLLVPKG